MQMFSIIIIIIIINRVNWHIHTDIYKMYTFSLYDDIIILVARIIRKREKRSNSTQYSIRYLLYPIQQ